MRILTLALTLAVLAAVAPVATAKVDDVGASSCGSVVIVVRHGACLRACTGPTVIVASHGNCNGADATEGQHAQSGCSGILTVLVGSSGNCNGGNG